MSTTIKSAAAGTPDVTLTRLPPPFETRGPAVSITVGATAVEVTIEDLAAAVATECRVMVIYPKTEVRGGETL